MQFLVALKLGVILQEMLAFKNCRIQGVIKQFILLTFFRSSKYHDLFGVGHGSCECIAIFSHDDSHIALPQHYQWNLPTKILYTVWSERTRFFLIVHCIYCIITKLHRLQDEACLSNYNLCGAKMRLLMLTSILRSWRVSFCF